MPILNKSEFKKVLHEFSPQIMASLMPSLASLILWFIAGTNWAENNITWLKEQKEKSNQEVSQYYKSFASEMIEDLKTNKKTYPIRERKKGDAAWYKKLQVSRHYWGFDTNEKINETLVWLSVDERTLAKDEARNDGNEDAREDLVYYSFVPPHSSPQYKIIIHVFGASLFTFAFLIAISGISSLIAYAKKRDDFMQSTAHDLRTPITGILLHTTKPERVRCIATRMKRIVQNITDFLSTGGNSKPNLTSVNLLDAYHEAYSSYSEDFRDNFGGKDIPTSFPKETPLVMADETFLVQILWNLLGNALKYAAPYANDAPNVFASIKMNKDVTSISISDFGPGLTKRQSKKIFNRFYRAKNIQTSGKGGFGIGLSTARENAKKMGANLSVSLNKPTGCVFTLRFSRQLKCARTSHFKSFCNNLFKRGV